ncbi:Chromobox protein 1-like protein [Dinothrombium tinctorium]|uniref:Chromobox protein 1-like protein n=1 Tax=Dinothrombium tinctorium TaxID=1965070 RepID=A0A3S3SNM3_9ACAR|nr:Chromobox protein 1-like protein [Dinothrombium tinctorium]RWS17826.1 Chromobox protein 1-like protein [Dinothrombium tinctorium]RWS17841.1 Chromobox protein 1-like protein [Dinothrombium tinctorium]
MSDSENSRESDVFEVEEIRGRRLVNGELEFRVKWKGYKEETWEPKSNIIDKSLIENFERKRNAKRSSANNSKRRNEHSDNVDFAKTTKKARTSINERESSEKRNEISVHTSDIKSENSSESKKQKPINVNQNSTNYSSENSVLSSDNKQDNYFELNNQPKVVDMNLTKDSYDKCAEVDKILSATLIDDNVYFLFKWKDSNREPSLISASEANTKYTRVITRFYLYDYPSYEF